MKSEFSIKLSLDPTTKILSCRMNNNSDRILVVRRPSPPLDLRISGPSSPHYRVLGWFSVPKVTIEPGRHDISTFPLPGNFFFTAPGEYVLHFSYRSLRSGGIGKTEEVDDVTAESNSVIFIVKPEDLPQRLTSRKVGTSEKTQAPAKAASTITDPPRRRTAKARAGKVRHQ